MSESDRVQGAAANGSRRAELVVQLTRLALAASDVPSAVTPILDHLVTDTQAAGSAYFQVDGEFYFARASSGVMPEGPAMEAVLAHGLPADTPLMRALGVASTPLFFDDTTRAAEAAGFPDLGVASLAAAPVRGVKDNLSGAFLMHTFEPHVWTSREADLFGTVAGVLASLAARLVAEEEAVVAREGALRALGLALEYRDFETKGHTDRVTDLCLQVAGELGVLEGHERELRWGAYLHDVGKIGIPDAILLKPGKLNDSEWDVMRGHSELGHAFAERLGFLPKGALDLILYHHERWAGGGYPDGKEGQAIPLTARIFSVCDVYDALVSERPYKRAWPHDEAVEEIEQQAGKQFDPAVVEAFLRTDYIQQGGGSSEADD